MKSTTSPRKKLENMASEYEARAAWQALMAITPYRTASAEERDKDRQRAIQTACEAQGIRMAAQSLERKGK